LSPSPSLTEKNHNESSLHICHPLLPFPKNITLTFPTAWLAISLAVRNFDFPHYLWPFFTWGLGVRACIKDACSNVILTIFLYYWNSKSNLDNSFWFFMSVIWLCWPCLPRQGYCV
jgi:hypothetical protein